MEWSWCEGRQGVGRGVCVGELCGRSFGVRASGKRKGPRGTSEWCGTKWGKESWGMQF